MTLGWKTKTLESLTRFRNGKSIKPGGSGAYPVYGSNGTIGASDEYMYEDAIILGRVGAYCGSVERCSGKFWASDNTIVVEANCDEVSLRFLYYMLIDANLNRHAGGAAQPLLTQSRLKPLEFDVPSLTVQRRIASILSTYDDLIENNTRRIATLEEMARRLYEEWFVHFRFPGHEDATFTETEYGRVPEVWELRKLQDYVELAYGKALKADDREEGPYPVFGSSGVVGTHTAYLVEGPGIIVGRKGNVGSVHWTERSFYPIDTVYYVKTELPLEYVFFNLQRQNFLNNDAAVPGLNRNQAYALPFLKPSDNVLETFKQQCAPLYDMVRLLDRKNANLRSQRDLLLPKLVSGEIDVSEAEETLEEAVA